VTAAVGIAGPRFRLNGTQIANLSHTVMRAATELSDINPAGV
jgi:hypothetical protein